MSRILLSRNVHDVLSSAGPDRSVSLPGRLFGAPRARLLQLLSGRGLVRVTNWSTAGDACAPGSRIGYITDRGRLVRQRGWM